MASDRFKPLALSEFRGSGASGHVSVPYSVLVEALGEPHKNDPIGQNPDYPDDDHKTDVSWGLRHVSGAHLYVWNYKNGPAYGDDPEVTSIEQINYFSWGVKGFNNVMAAAAARADFFQAIGVSE